MNILNINILIINMQYCDLFPRFLGLGYNEILFVFIIIMLKTISNLSKISKYAIKRIPQSLLIHTPAFNIAC